jgi:hypothetical protein
MTKTARFIDSTGASVWQTPISAPCALGFTKDDDGYSMLDELRLEAIEAGIAADRLAGARLIVVSV